MDTQRYTFHVTGMHCKACEHLIEDELKDIAGVETVHADLAAQTVTVVGSLTGDADMLVRTLSESIKEHGYMLSRNREAKPISWSDFAIAIPVALVFFGAFLLLQRTGLVHLIGDGEVSYGTALVIGVIASLSSCMAVVGGLVLSLSASYAKEEKSTVLPHTLFHVSRLISFFLLGGVIGAIGTAFTLSTTATFVLGVLIGLVMLVLGVNLLDIFHTTKKFQFAMPKIFAAHAFRTTDMEHTLAPVLAGIATFFLPCGFTQSMQLYTLGSGGFVAGGLTMLTFAFGTLPVLALMSFVSFKFHKSKYAGVFFKSAGLIVIGFALMNIINSFVIVGAFPPIFTF